MRPALLSTGNRAMADSRQWSTRWLTIAAVLCAGVLLTPAESAAEIVIDDFDDPMQITLPDDAEEFVNTWDVGELAAWRAAFVVTLQTNPNGVVDVDLTEPSTLTATIPDTDNYGSQPSIVLNLDYGLVVDGTGVDLTEGHTNDAVILDFRKLAAAVPIYVVRVEARQNIQTATGETSSLYFSDRQPVLQSPQAFSLVFPFDAFRVGRGSEIPDFDFSYICELDVVIKLAHNTPNLPERLGFEMVLDRVRVGRVVPEPTSLVELAVLLAVLGVWRQGSPGRCCNRVRKGGERWERAFRRRRGLSSRSWQP